MRDALVDGGITCDTPPRPYEADEGEMDLGIDPSEELVCEIDGVTVTATKWETEAERASTMTLAVEFICGFVSGSRWHRSTGRVASKADKGSRTVGRATG